MSVQALSFAVPTTLVRESRESSGKYFRLKADWRLANNPSGELYQAQAFFGIY